MTNTFKNLQKTLNSLNGKTVTQLQIPDKFKNLTSEITILQKWLGDNKPIEFMRYNQPLHPNVIKYFLDNSVINRIESKRGRVCMISSDNKIKINIMKQYYFTYQLMNSLSKNAKIEKLFFDNGYISNNFLKVEVQKTPIFGSQKKYSLDLTLSVSDEQKIIIEYFEKQHNNMIINDQLRLADIITDNHYKKAIIVWEDELKNTFVEKRIMKKIKSTVTDLITINNERTYIIKKLNVHIENLRLSRMLYESFTNKNKPILKEKEISDLLSQYVKKTSIKSVLERAHAEMEYLMEPEHEEQEEDSDIIDSESDSESENENTNRNEFEQDLYFSKVKSKYLYTQKGLILIIKNVNLTDTITKKKYTALVKLSENIAESSIESIKEIRDLELNLQKNLLWGFNKEDYY